MLSRQQVKQKSTCNLRNALLLIEYIRFLGILRQQHLLCAGLWLTRIILHLVSYVNIRANALIIKTVVEWRNVLQ